MLNKPMLISVHDVMPQWERELFCLFDSLAHLDGKVISVAVVPGIFQTRRDARLIEAIRERQFDIALHGYTHQGHNYMDPVTYLTSGSNEMSGRRLSDALTRIAQGQQRLHELFGEPARVFVPPAWQMGPLHLNALNRFGISHVMGLTHMQFATSKTAPLSTWSWDCGRFKSIGWLGEGFGHLRFWTTRSTPCVVLHPRDVQRGFLNRSLQLIQGLMARGYHPVRLSAWS